MAQVQRINPPWEGCSLICVHKIVFHFSRILLLWLTYLLVAWHSQASRHSMTNLLTVDNYPNVKSSLFVVHASSSWFTWLNKVAKNFYFYYLLILLIVPLILHQNISLFLYFFNLQIVYLRTCDLDNKWNTSADTLCIHLTSFCVGWLYGHMQDNFLKFGVLRRMQAK